MNAPSPSRRPAASSTDSAVRAPALVPVSLDTHRAANDDTEPITARHGNGPRTAVNPLWMITAALALFLAAMAIFISS